MRTGGLRLKTIDRIHAAVLLLPLLAAFSGCAKKEEDPGAANPDTGPVSENRVGPGEEEKSLVYLRGKPVTRSGTRVRSVQTLELTDGTLTTSSSTGGSSQGKAVMTDREIRNIKFVSDKEKVIDLEEKTTVTELSVAGAEPTKNAYTSPLQGLKLSALRKADGTWWFGLKEGTATAEQMAELQEFGDPEVLSLSLYPEKPVSMGDKWESDLAAIRGLLGPAFQPKSGTVKLQINHLRNVEGQRCAELDVNLDCEGIYRSGPSPVAMKLELKGRILRSLNTFQDLKTELGGIMTLEQTVKGIGEDKSELKIDGVVRFTRENKVTQPPEDGS